MLVRQLQYNKHKCDLDTMTSTFNSGHLNKKQSQLSHSGHVQRLHNIITVV